MQRPSGTAAVRLSLWTLLAVALTVALLEPALAGTEAAPEIQDPAGDVALGPIPACAEGLGCTSDAVDIITVWIDGENATHVNFNIRANGDIVGGLQDIPLGVANFDVTFTVGGTESTASVSVDDTGVATPAGVASNATVNGTLLTISVAKSGIGNPAAGAALTGLSAASELAQALGPIPLGLPFGSDSAAAAADVTYTFTGGSAAPPVDPDDTDGDGMNDTCEMQYFGNLTHNETEDADGDTLTNGQECALGTDPTKADSDGDGTNDNLDPAPTDPTVGGASSTSTSATSTTPPPTTTTRPTTTSAPTTGGTSDDDDGDVKSLSDAVEKLKSDPGYLGLSGGGFLAVLVLCIIALAVRWSL